MKTLRPLGLTALLWILAAFPVLAQDRTLRWAELAVRARLDASGALQVEERHTMVFTGDWNGGERTFRVPMGQDLELRRLSRVDPQAGTAHPLTEGDLSQVDHYQWEGWSLRWRSRLPSDPPFAETTIPYVIEYTLTGLLSKGPRSFHLNHDFAFPDRQWPVERFTLDLEVDPAWQPLAGSFPLHLEKENLLPGEGSVVRTEFTYQGPEGALSAVRTGTPANIRLLLFAAALAAMVFLSFTLRHREKALGRYSPPSTPGDWDEAWLRDNLFLYLPEEVGALWDQKVGPPEVAATLARLVGEGKLASEVRPKKWFFGNDVLHLTRIAGRESFTGYERDLIDKLFFDGGTTTDTGRIRQRYKKSGFNPAALIEKDLRARLAGQAELAGATPRPSRLRTFFLFLGVVVLFGLESATSHGVLWIVFSLLPVLFLYLWGMIAAYQWRKRLVSLDAALLTFFIPGLGILAWSALITFLNDLPAGPFMSLRPGLWGDLALALVPVTAWSSMVNCARTRESAETVRRRHFLGAARRMFQRELKQSSPRLRDEWLPYLLAFGLERDVDRWFRAFGGAGPAAASFSTYSTGSSGGSSGGGGWTGGGGAFGGAGSSSSWAAAATGLAAGVSAASSSSSGGGGGGGSSSGGGGGGGW